MTERIIDNIKMSLYGKIPTEHIQRVLETIVVELAKYDIKEKETALVVYDCGDAELLQKFFVDKAVAGLSERSMKYYKEILKGAFQEIGKHIRDITTDDVRILLARKRMKGNSETHIDNVRRVLSSFFGWGYKEEILKHNIMMRISKVKTQKKVRKAFTEDELELLRVNANSIRNKAVIEFLYSTGCRISEMVGLNRDQIDFDTCTCIVLGKGNKQRPVYFSVRCKVLLQEYLKSRKDNNPALFVTDLQNLKGISIVSQKLKDGPQRVQADGMRNMIHSTGKRAGVENCHPHRFRRTAATIALRRGMSIEQVQKMLGHESIATTTIYANSDQSDIKAAHDKYLI